MYFIKRKTLKFIHIKSTYIWCDIVLISNIKAQSTSPPASSSPAPSSPATPVVPRYLYEIIDRFSWNFQGLCAITLRRSCAILEGLARSPTYLSGLIRKVMDPNIYQKNIPISFKLVRVVCNSVAQTLCNFGDSCLKPDLFIGPNSISHKPKHSIRKNLPICFKVSEIV